MILGDLGTFKEKTLMLSMDSEEKSGICRHKSFKVYIQSLRLSSSWFFFILSLSCVVFPIISALKNRKRTFSVSAIYPISDLQIKGVTAFPHARFSWSGRTHESLLNCWNKWNTIHYLSIKFIKIHGDRLQMRNSGFIGNMTEKDEMIPFCNSSHLVILITNAFWVKR